MNALIAVFIGGGIGSVCRYLISKWVVGSFAQYFPLATLISNVTSSLILALLIAFLGQKIMGDSMMRLLLIVGFCGGFSTFSTFGYETFVLLKSANYTFAALNVIVSVVAALAILFLLVKEI